MKKKRINTKRINKRNEGGGVEEREVYVQNEKLKGKIRFKIYEAYQLDRLRDTVIFFFFLLASRLIYYCLFILV